MLPPALSVPPHLPGDAVCVLPCVTAGTMEVFTEGLRPPGPLPRPGALPGQSRVVEFKSMSHHSVSFVRRAGRVVGLILAVGLIAGCSTSTEPTVQFNFPAGTKPPEPD